MLTNRFFIAFILFSCGVARAEIHSETTCYSSVPKGSSSKPLRLAMRNYEDKDLKKEVGAFIQYSSSKEIIPLVFTKYISADTDYPSLGNYEISRVEISDSKINGVYVFVQTGAGNTQGKYVKYTDLKTGKSTIFVHTGDDDPACKINN